MRARTVFTASLLACIAVLSAGAGACGSSPGATESRPNGQACGSTGNSSCASDHCDNGFCCAAGNCCGVAGDCPASYRSPAACDDTGSTTTCQGKRRDATCAEGTCATATVDDDSACAGAVRDCTPFRPITCTSAASQPVATCLTACTGNADCAAGYACAGGQCLVKVGMGAACSGAGQGTCNDGLKCENAVCCDAASATCCTQGAQCPGGLACDTAATHACFTTCADGTADRCAVASTFCQANGCVAKLSQGTACTADAMCGTGACSQGVCCDRACTSACQSCNDPSTPGTRGQCTAIGDDARCGTISCQGLNGQCRAYADVTANRCTAGACKPPNDTGTCTSFTDSNASCGLCQKCAGGTCVNQLATEDLKNECPAASCLSGVCNGAGACAFAAAGTGCSDGNACSSGDVCDGAGRCAGTPFSCVGGLCKTSTCNGSGCTVVNLTGDACGHCGTCENGVCVGSVPPTQQCP